MMSKFSIDPPDHNFLKIYTSISSIRSYPVLVWVITLEVSRRTLFTPEVVVTFSPGLSEPGAGMFFTLEIISLEMYSSQRSSEVFSGLKYDFVKETESSEK